MPAYKDCPKSIVHLAQALIGQYHPILRECNIGFVFRDEAATSGGKVVLARTTKVPENLKPLLPDELDILIVIAEDQWVQLSSAQQVALVDHELCHIALADGGWKLRAHDLEEFEEIIERYGLWSADLWKSRSTLAHAMQLELSIAGVEKTPRGGVVALDADKFNQAAADLEAAAQPAAAGG